MLEETKKVMFVLPVMKGGGAERVASLLANEFHKNGIETSFLLTSSAKEYVIRVDLDPEIPLRTLSELPRHEGIILKFAGKIMQLASSAFCKFFEFRKKPVPAGLACWSFKSQNREEILKLRTLLAKDPELMVIAFLQPSIPITLLAAKGLPNRVIFSERADPNRLMKKRYGRKFIEEYYPRADAAVFQTFDAKDAYPACVSEKGTVISNPLKADLPEPYFGERTKNITTFCRISAQKNLPLLFEAFAKLYKEHPAYKLRIIGDASNDEGTAIEAQLRAFINEHDLADAVIFEPFMKEVHGAVIRDAMYVNSSDYEGISNAMLEAMAIGMPVVCTDCPIGGARATIQDGENGLLVPVGDCEALYRAMKRIIEEPGLAEKLSENAAKLREELSLPKIAEKWMKLL